jgi:hypothetical protein
VFSGQPQVVQNLQLTLSSETVHSFAHSTQIQGEWLIGDLLGEAEPITIHGLISKAALIGLNNDVRLHLTFPSICYACTNSGFRC